MNYEAIARRYPLAPEHYKHYLNKSTTPPLKPGELAMRFVYGTERKKAIKTPTAGDMSLVILYKNKEAVVSSLGLCHADLEVLQLQGRKTREGYRVSIGLYWTDLMADETMQIAVHPESGVFRIVMQHPLFIEGLVEAESELAIQRYQYFIARTGLRWSDEEKIFARDIHPTL